MIERGPENQLSRGDVLQEDKSEKTGDVVMRGGVGIG